MAGKTGRWASYFVVRICTKDIVYYHTTPRSHLISPSTTWDRCISLREVTDRKPRFAVVSNEMYMYCTCDPLWDCAVTVQTLRLTSLAAAHNDFIQFRCHDWAKHAECWFSLMSSTYLLEVRMRLMTRHFSSNCIENFHVQNKHICRSQRSCVYLMII